jgi:hypothetical protein
MLFELNWVAVFTMLLKNGSVTLDRLVRPANTQLVNVNKKLSKSLDGPPFASSTKCSLLQLAIG